MPSCPKPTGWIRDAKWVPHLTTTSAPERLPIRRDCRADASEADALEQFQPVEDDDDWRD